MDRRRLLLEIINRLSDVYRPREEEYIALYLLKQGVNDFEFLVGVILSQNTSDRNALEAYKRLKMHLGVITPDTILSLQSEKLEELIRVAGMTKRRVEAFKALAMWFKENEELVKRFKNMSPDDVRKHLMSVYGIGSKTADVYILMRLGMPAFPIDTHIKRVLSRLGIFSCTGYECLSKSIIEALNNDVEMLKKLHILLIEHGRKVCKARAPQCDKCTIREYCNYYVYSKAFS
jgi:endonuclease-3